MSEHVTREEFDRLLSILHDMTDAVPHHTHGMPDGSMYGGSTYGPEERDNSRSFQARILALLNEQPEPEEDGERADV